MNQPKRILKSTIFFLSASLLFLSGCGGGSSEDVETTSLLLVENVKTLTPSLVSGYEDIIVTGDEDRGKKYLKIHQKDATTQSLINLGTVYLGVDNTYRPIQQVSTNSQWATTIMSGTFNGSESFVALVDVNKTNGYSLDLLLNINDTIEYAVASDHYLLLSSTNQLALYDISDLTAPVLTKSFTSTGNISTIVSVTNGFYAINTNGLLYIDYSDNSNITSTEIIDIDIKESQKAYVVGNNMYIAGDSKFAGKSKIAKVDIATLNSPNILLLNDTIVGIYASYNIYDDFSYDSASGKYYLLLSNDIHEYIESNGGLTLTNSAKLNNSTHSVDAIYARDGYIYMDEYFLNSYRFK